MSLDNISDDYFMVRVAEIIQSHRLGEKEDYQRRAARLMQDVLEYMQANKLSRREVLRLTKWALAYLTLDN